MRYDFCHTHYAAQIATMLTHGAKAADSMRRAGHEDGAGALEALIAEQKEAKNRARNTPHTPTDQAPLSNPNQELQNPILENPAHQNPALTAEVFKAFAAMLDPTHNRSGGGKAFKYLHWICASYLTSRHNGAPIMVEDFYKIRGNLSDFETWSGRLHHDSKSNQIDDPSLAGGFDALQKLLTPYQRHREEKQIARQERVMSEDDKKRLQTETTTLYSGAEGKIVLAHSWHATKYWGNRTKWCITERGTDSYFHSYNQKSPIILYLPTPTPADYAATEGQDLYSFKFAAVEGNLWNETDKTQRGGFPPCLHRLANAAARHFEAAAEESGLLAYLTKFALLDRIVADSQNPDKPDPAEGATPLCHALTAGAPQEWANHAENIYRAVLDQVGSKAPDYDTAVAEYLQNHCPDLAQDRDFMRFIVIQHPLLLSHIPARFRDDKPLALALPEKESSTSTFENFPEHIRHDRDVVMTWARKTSYILDHTSLALRADKALIEAAMQGWGNALEYVFPPQSWRNNRLSNLFAFYTQPFIQGLPNLRDDRDLVVKAVRKNGGYALKHASPRLKDDAEIVDISPSCYEHASRRLRRDKDRTRRAVLSDATSFQYAPKFLRKDPEFILSLLADKATPRLCEYVHKSVLSNPDFIKKAVAIHGDCLFYSKAPVTEDLLFDAIKTSAHAFRMRHRIKSENGQKRSYDEESAFERRLIDKAVTINGNIISEVSESRLSESAIEAALTKNPEAISHLAQNHNYRLQSVFQNRDVMLSVMKNIETSGKDMTASIIAGAYKQMPENLQADAEIAWYAAEKSPQVALSLPPYTVMRAEIILNAALHNPAVLGALSTVKHSSGNPLASPYAAQKIINHALDTGRGDEIPPYLRLFPCLWGNFDAVANPVAAQRALKDYAGPASPDARAMLAAAPKPARYARNTFYI